MAGAHEPEATAVAWPQVDAAVRRWLRGRVPAAAVDDLAQEAMLRLVRAAPRTEIRSPEAFALTAARSVLADDARRRARGRAVSTDPHLLEQAVGETAVRPHAEAPDLTARLSRCAAPLIARLPSEQREALLTVAEGRLSQRAAAERAGISTPGMKSRVQRARRGVLTAIEACCHVERDRRGRPIALSPRAPTGCRCGCSAG